MKGIKDRQYWSFTQASWYFNAVYWGVNETTADMPTVLHIQGPDVGQPPHRVTAWAFGEEPAVTSSDSLVLVTSCSQPVGGQRLLTVPHTLTPIHRMNTRLSPSLFSTHLYGLTDLKADLLSFCRCRSTEKKWSSPLSPHTVGTALEQHPAVLPWGLRGPLLWVRGDPRQFTLYAGLLILRGSGRMAYTQHYCSLAQKQNKET